MPQCCKCWRQARYVKLLPDGKWWWQKDRKEYFCTGHARGEVFNLRTGKWAERSGKFYS